MQVGTQQTYDNGKTTAMAKEVGNIDNIQVVVSSPSPIHRPRKSISHVTEYFYDELMMAVSNNFIFKNNLAFG